MVIVWYNCKDKRISSIVGESIIFLNIYRRFTIIKPYFLHLVTTIIYLPVTMLQEIDDMQAKIVIYLRIIIQFIKFNYLCTMCFINLAMVLMTVNFIWMLSWWLEEMFLIWLSIAFINNLWYFWIVCNKINDTCLKNRFTTI